jgi:phenylacetic acid degradation operon negative regulatory protein
MPGSTKSAQRPRSSRRQAAGVDSSRGLLFTVLGEFVLPTGAAWTSSFIDVFNRLGVEEKTARQALMRTSADGWLSPERIGRRTIWRLTSDAQKMLSEGAERIYRFTGATSDWDGRWLLVLAKASETEPQARHLIRTRLALAGLGSPVPGVWVSTHLDRLPDVESILREADMLDEAQVFVAEHRAGGPLAVMVSQAWDLDALERQYEAFIAEFSAGAARRDQLARVVELVNAWRRFPWIDPLLPAELLPRDWGGVKAAQLFGRLHADWSAEANAEWRHINDEAS